jgi:hypothetical protein
MMTCPNPSCGKALPALMRACPSCQADLSLLVDYVDQLHNALDRAGKLTRAGELAKAVWAYLEVLEVDPANPAARSQVAQVAAAVRQFDRTAPARPWHEGLPSNVSKKEGVRHGWWKVGLLILFFLAGLFFGYLWGAAN